MTINESREKMTPEQCIQVLDIRRVMASEPDPEVPTDPGSLQRLSEALEWALPILCVATMAPKDRESLAARLELEAKGFTPAGLERKDLCANGTAATLIEAAALIRLSVPELPIKNNRHMIVLRGWRATVALMARESKASAQLGPVLPEAWNDLLWALDWLLPWAKMLPDTRPVPAHADEVMLKALESVATHVHPEMAGTVRWAILRISQNPTPGPNPDPLYDEQCPSCKRTIVEIRGEAPTAVKVWVCSDCFDVGLTRLYPKPATKCSYGVCQEPPVTHCREHQDSKNCETPGCDQAASLFCQICVESMASRMKPDATMMKARATGEARLLDAYKKEALEKGTGIGMFANLLTCMFAVMTQAADTLQSWPEWPPAVGQCEMRFLTENLPGGLAKSKGCQNAKSPYCTDCVRVTLNKPMPESEMPDGYLGYQRLTRAAIRIRQQIEDWHEAEGTESERQDTTRGHKSRAAERKLTLFRVLGLFSSADLTEPNVDK